MTRSTTPRDVAVVAVVVTHRAVRELAECVESLDAAGGLTHLIVVDNGGAAEVAAGPARTIVRPTRNGGFGAGANAGFSVAASLDADVVVLLNDDVTVRDGWLAPLVSELLDDSEVGAVQPMLVFSATSEVNSLGVVIGGDGAGHDAGLGRPVGSVDLAPHDIDVFTGGAVAFRPDFLADTGGFDERYFLYYEDVDLARRGARHGWRYRCVPASVVEHRKGASTEALGDRVVYLRERNRLWSAFRNEPARIVVGALWLSVRRVRHAPRRVHLKALAAGLSGGLWRVVERLSAC